METKQWYFAIAIASKVETWHALAMETRRQRKYIYQIMEKKGQLFGDQTDIEFEVGNLYEKLENVPKSKHGFHNCHKWTMFVKTKNPK